MVSGLSGIGTVLVANRGEIALRVIRTLRRLGLRSVAVHSDADAGARHVREADAAVRLASGYLDIEGVVAAAKASGARAVHPGYGFLAENTAFARRCAEEGLVFVGPPPPAIEAMGDKIRAKATVAAAGVPVVPGGAEPGDDLAEAAARIGFPVLIKPSAGGGGKGMLVVRSAGELAEAVASARRTAAAAFGDATLLVERYVSDPRHIEIQVLADTHGNVIHLGERECSLQRRHQKIVEEAPSPLIDEETRRRMGAAAVSAARSVGYVGAGTVEFIVPGDQPGHPGYFIEMNTRLQVEHPVTEMVTGLDLVELQLRVAAGEPLPLAQQDVRMRGHAVEARVYAEDPARDFLPTGGRVLALAEPEDAAGVRVDSGLFPGAVVGSDYDPMLAKVIAWGSDRAAALRGLDTALRRTTVLGVTTNIAFLRALLADADVAAGRLGTGLIDQRLDALLAAAHATGAPPDEVLAAAALVLHDELSGGDDDPWDVPDGWRIGEPAWTTWPLAARGEPVAVRVRGLPARGAEVAVGDGPPSEARVAREGGDALVTLDGVTTRYACARDGHTVWLGRDGRAWALTRHLPGDPGDRAGAGLAGDGVVRSPMPGTVLLVKVVPGEAVTEGQPLLIVEAMKMEHTVTAPADGVVAELTARAGRPVDMDEVLAVIRAPDAGASPEATETGGS
ncbi:acetyl/propionyl-CoA carboxylase subuit alpha [Sphaerisporangium krabiense]|uniref:Biotin-dependent 3-methylcrotonyl-coenzyme A carboxylase alpha1 subunit n=1 Tax=Sphaerisporangium krabiense TaxID=763782 RepID=A0A7W9DTH0_9ACTN|nr:biotin carboxylase N-terminal domain-containing protein [Sphaerisporangium krabiense]MBB5630623.1 acetyl-CoA/propionyl-CoA carboxylase biotin carboxyl carrier protein [Sphaerisporangium krabiense]GII62420.1 acetyl/propionyl-CoA carboxylase subuit alpha [Sphaerisporangium krabiense]